MVAAGRLDRFKADATKATKTNMPATPRTKRIDNAWLRIRPSPTSRVRSAVFLPSKSGN